jgi:hypothetical protein
MRVLVQQYKPFTPSAGRQQRGSAAPPSARLGGGSGGGGYGGNSGGNRDPRLILPGQQNNGGGNSGGGSRLVMPGQGSGGSSGGSLVGGGGGPAPVQNFRPPPGFMFMEKADMGPDAPESSMSSDEMLNRLRGLSGHWHQLAKFLPALQRMGIDGMAVEEATGLERKTQNVWNTAAQVHESIAAPGLLSPEDLAHFDAEGEYLLYELRFLSVRQRAPVASFIAQRNLRWVLVWWVGGCMGGWGWGGGGVLGCWLPVLG